jgi:hypothetical protein
MLRIAQMIRMTEQKSIMGAKMIAGFKTAVRVAIALCALILTVHADADRYPPKIGQAEIEQLLLSAPAEHPRLFASSADFEKLRERSAEDPLMARLAEGIVREALALRELPPIERTMRGRRLLQQSRIALERISVLALAWHLDDDAAHVRRADREMLAIAKFSDWNPSHFLDVAEMALAMAIGYDWLYAELSEESRETIRKALVAKALELPFTTHKNLWALRAHNNWGQVCNAGLCAAALALLEDEPELAARTVHNAVHLVVNSMKVYDPKGSYPEGPTYWHYGTSFNVLLIDALESVLGSGFGLDAAPGFASSGEYPEIATGPSGLPFNYADGGAGIRPAWPAVFWFAHRFERPDLAWLELQRLERDYAAGRYAGSLPGGRLAAFMLLWMDEPEESLPEIELPRAWHSGCPKVPVAIFRSGWADPDAVYFGLKGGSPSAPHGHMDIGSFVLDADGVRWAIDLGAQSYTEIEARGMSLWNFGQNSDRWRIFRLNQMSHNLVLIDGQAQQVKATAPIDRFSDNPEFSFAQIDLGAVYAGQAASVRRGMAMLPGGAVLIRDELSGVAPGAEVRWAMLTRAAPRELGGRNLQLEYQGRTMRLIQPEGEAVWQEISTDQPPAEWDAPNPGTRMVALIRKAPADGALSFTVLAVPGSSTATSPDRQKLLRPLNEW